MTEYELDEDQLPAIGHPDQEHDAEAPRDEQADFAGEHNDTAVDEDIVRGENGEEESPKGWAGQEE